MEIPATVLVGCLCLCGLLDPYSRSSWILNHYGDSDEICRLGTFSCLCELGVVLFVGEVLVNNEKKYVFCGAPPAALSGHASGNNLPFSACIRAPDVWNLPFLRMSCMISSRPL